MLLKKIISFLVLNFVKFSFYDSFEKNMVKGAVIMNPNFEQYDFDRLYAYEEFCDPYDYQCDDTEYVKLFDFYFTVQDVYR